MRLSAPIFFTLTFIVLAGLFALSVPYGSSRHPFGMPLPTTAIGGILAWGIVGLLSLRMKRPFGVVDGVRCMGWILIGCGFGMSTTIGSYYRYFWPQYYDLGRTASLAIGIAGAVAIVGATVLLSAPEPLKPGGCRKCGYNLTGNVSGMCPECGTRIQVDNARAEIGTASSSELARENPR